VAYYHGAVASNGGYLWRYSADLSVREGEFHPAFNTVRPTETQVWVQPPGTPSVGLAYVSLFETTGETVYLDAAKDAAGALAWGQLAVGGWDYKIDFDSVASQQWFFRRDKEGGVDPAGRRNTATFDDNVTQSALRLIMAVDKLTGFAEPYHSSALYGLKSMMENQFENGAWSQRYPVPDNYTRLYTFNDNAINDCIDVMLTAYRTYGDERYLQSAVRGGDFIVASRIAAPQEGWAQQYGEDMEPAWARRFEPPAVCSAVTARNIKTLVQLFLETGEDRFLAAIGPAVAWLERSRIPAPDGYREIRGAINDGLWARFYEVGTNLPIYGDRDRVVHYVYGEISEERKRGYGWYGDYGSAAIELHRAVLDAGRERYLTERDRAPSADENREAAVALRPSVEEAIASMDEQGRWVDDGWITMRTYLRNLGTLRKCLELTSDD
jgi:PelA/Pel-15E family pectate lyase